MNRFREERIFSNVQKPCSTPGAPGFTPETPSALKEILLLIQSGLRPRRRETAIEAEILPSGRNGTLLVVMNPVLQDGGIPSLRVPCASALRILSRKRIFSIVIWPKPLLRPRHPKTSDPIRGPFSAPF